jgi:hypothetical protein
MDSKDDQKSVSDMFIDLSFNKRLSNRDFNKRIIRIFNNVSDSDKGELTTLFSKIIRNL